MIYFIGVLVSLLVAQLKKIYSTNEWKTLGILAGVSLVAAIAYTYLVSAGLFGSVAAILESAGAFYAFVLQRFNSN